MFQFIEGIIQCNHGLDVVFNIKNWDSHPTEVHGNMLLMNYKSSIDITVMFAPIVEI